MDELAAVLALFAAVTFALAATLSQKAALSLSRVSVRHPKSLLLGAVVISSARETAYEADRGVSEAEPAPA